MIKNCFKIHTKSPLLFIFSGFKLFEMRNGDMSTRALSQSDSLIFAPSTEYLERHIPGCPRVQGSSLEHFQIRSAASKVASHVLENTPPIPDQLPPNVKSKLSSLSFAESRFYLTRSDPTEYLFLQFTEIEDE